MFYRYFDEEQKKIIEESKAEYEKAMEADNWTSGMPIHTEIISAKNMVIQFYKLDSIFNKTKNIFVKQFFFLDLLHGRGASSTI